MGWSATTAACETFDRWTRVCVAQTGIQNVYENGAEFMFERGREQADGAITGSVYRMPEGVRTGSFRINADGSVARLPQGLGRVIDRSLR